MTTVSNAPPERRASMLVQTWAMVVDAYRELNAKRLFWITLFLSLAIVAAFAFVGINERGVVVFGYELPGLWNTSLIPKAAFYKFVFTNLAIPYWLGFGATILALISVCGIFPDFLASGSVDLYLSKPISRFRLFITKYILSLMFVALQVFVFALAAFLVIGFRGGSWEWGIFLAVPLVTLFFSYLFCVCVLLGVITRSALASMLITILLWGAIFVVNASDGALLAFKSAAEERVERQKQLIAFNEDVIKKNEALPENVRGDMQAFVFQRDSQISKLPDFQDDASKLQFWHRLVTAIKAPLPKTAETITLLDRWLVEPDPFFKAEEASRQERDRRRTERGLPPVPERDRENNARFDPSDPEVARRIQQELDARKAVYLLGTSLAFEVVVLAIAGWIFARRDF